MSVTLESLPSTGISSLPAGSVQADLFGYREELKKLGDKRTFSNLIPLKALNADLDRLALEEMDAVKQFITAADNQNAWSHQQLIFSLISAASSIIGGAYLLASGEKKGINFVATGSISLSNTLMDHFGGWTSLAQTCSLGYNTAEATLKLLPFVISIFTSCYSTYNMLNLPIEHKTWMAYIDQILSYINLALQIGTLYTTIRKGQADFKLLDLQNQTTIITKKIQPITHRNEAIGGGFNTILSTMKNTLLNITRINSAIMAY